MPQASGRPRRYLRRRTRHRHPHPPCNRHRTHPASNTFPKQSQRQHQGLCNHKRKSRQDRCKCRRRPTCPRNCPRRHKRHRRQVKQARAVAFSYDIHTANTRPHRRRCRRCRRRGTWPTTPKRRAGCRCSRSLRRGVRTAALEKSRRDRCKCHRRNARNCPRRRKRRLGPGLERDPPHTPIASSSLPLQSQSPEGMFVHTLKRGPGPLQMPHSSSTLPLQSQSLSGTPEHPQSKIAPGPLQTPRPNQTTQSSTSSQMPSASASAVHPPAHARRRAGCLHSRIARWNASTAAARRPRQGRCTRHMRPSLQRNRRKPHLHPGPQRS